MNGFRNELIEKIIGFNAHVVVKPYENPINKKKLRNKELINISDNFLLSNSGEGVLINKNYTKGLLLRGYSQKEFQKLDIVKSKNFFGNNKFNLSFLITSTVSKEVLPQTPHEEFVKKFLFNLPISMFLILLIVASILF